MLSAFPDKSFDLILTDPPYGSHVHKNLGRERRNDGSKPRVGLKFPPMTKEIIETVAKEFVRLSKAWILVFCDFQSTHLWAQAIEAAGGMWVRTGQWVKTNPMPQMTGDRPAVGAEDILIAHATGEDLSWNGGGHPAIWRGPRDAKTAHPNQKPEWLIQSLLGQFCPPDGTVLDPYLGSGTTAVAALRRERVYGEIAVGTACKPCGLKIASEYLPPLPVRVKVVGFEGDMSYACVAAERIRNVPVP